MVTADSTVTGADWDRLESTVEGLWFRHGDHQEVPGHLQDLRVGR
ncbi:hypothetical protein LV779_21235 [Streptomyces thinghirensis]|nr:hypothetical protein [Streptomyces thinghirensis]